MDTIEFSGEGLVRFALDWFADVRPLGPDECHVCDMVGGASDCEHPRVLWNFCGAFMEQVKSCSDSAWADLCSEMNSYELFSPGRAGYNELPTFQGHRMGTSGIYAFAFANRPFGALQVFAQLMVKLILEQPKLILTIRRHEINLEMDIERHNYLMVPFR